MKVSELYAFSLFLATSTLFYFDELPEGFLNPFQENFAHLNGAGVSEFEHHSVVAVLDVSIEVDHVVNVLVAELIGPELLELRVEVLDVIEGQQVQQHDSLQLVEVVRLLQLPEVLVEELQLLDGARELSQVLAGKTIEHVVFCEVPYVIPQVRAALRNSSDCEFKRGAV